ncbi:hypothetical protein PHJA_000441600 [Phtheirospermum japonicum]|uniref:Uncharacterized protein n=1 Tax=Phtheirospermum japonicum TaxID=374723 RepID=A0A830BGF1_9LAMI|nr:hypothetical protein PHJA_000441600 [Phtheirospermum japonicum]
MENSSQLILEISSDEEVGFGEPGKAGDYGVGGGGFGGMDDCDWLSELLGEVGDNKNDDTDDVVLVSETFANPPKKSRFESLKPSSKVVDDDDDCVILDGDPDKPVVAAAVNCGVGYFWSHTSERHVFAVADHFKLDFPHARHLCVKFLFASSPHATHCSQCHCYVCDSLAPCSHWGTGVSSIDHCHATDKDEYWKTERKRIKNGDKPMSAVIPCGIPNTSHSQSVFQPTTQAPPLSPLSPQWSKSPFPLTPIVRPVTAHLSSGPTAARPIPVIRAPRSQLSHILKRPGLVGASPPNNSHLHGPQLPTSSLKRCRVLKQTPVPTHQRVMGTRTVRPTQQVSYPQSVNNVGHANYLHFSHPHFQQYVNTTNFVSTVAHSQPHVASQTSVFRPKTYVPSQNAIGSEMHSIYTIPSNQIAGNNNLESRSSQLQARGNPNSSLFGTLSDFQKVNNHTQNGIYANTNDFGLAWDYSSLIPGNMQVQGAVQLGQSVGPVENSQIQSVVEPVIDNNYQQQGVDNNGGCQFPESIPNGTFDFLFDNLMFESNSVPVVSEVPVSPLWNAYSPEPASVDTGNLFDF